MIITLNNKNDALDYYQRFSQAGGQNQFESLRSANTPRSFKCKDEKNQGRPVFSGVNNCQYPVANHFTFFFVINSTHGKRVNKVIGYLFTI
jgi:hypothetical protein